MIRLRTLGAALGAGLALIVLAGCGAQPGPAVSSDQPVVADSPAPTASVAASASAPAATAASADGMPPKDCRKIVPADVYSATFGQTPLNDPAFTDLGPTGVVTDPPAVAPQGDVLASGTKLQCIWRDPNADTTGLELRIGSIPGIAEMGQYFDEFQADGATCSQSLGGTLCQRITQNPEYPVQDALTVLGREGLFVEVRQSNFPTKNLMASIATTIWG